MGCSSSRSDTSSVVDDLNDIGQLQEMATTAANIKGSDYKDRLETSEGTILYHFPKSNFAVRYAFVSQRGYYPTALDKPNQDSFYCRTAFGSDKDQALFGVFDGHGEFGTQCSQYARDKLPANIFTDPNFQNAPEAACHHACVLTNMQLRSSPIDDEMSGTTCIMCLLRGTTLIVINVGDSRAVIAERQDERLVAQDLSWDQTPMRPDECERCKQAGARVLTLDQLEGLKDSKIQSWTTQEEDDGDAPRLWAQQGKYPGTAFTRSIGDAAAEAIGVFAEPEVLVKRLSARNPFLIVASDGVWEFLSSQSVVDMVSKYDDPQEAAMAIVAESYRLWLQHESRTDDITMIIIQFQGIEDDASLSMALPTPYGSPLDYSAKEASNSQKFYPMKIKAVEARGEPPLVESLAVIGATPLTSEQIQRLAHATRTNFIFNNLPLAQRQLCLQSMERLVVHSGEIVIEQGQLGEGYYVVQSGQFDVLVRKPDGKLVLVHTYVAHGEELPSFGELALLYGKPQAASIVARMDGVLLLLRRSTFKSIMAHHDALLGVEMLRPVGAFQKLTWGQLQAIFQKMTVRQFENGEVIAKQGDVLPNFCLLTQGEVRCKVRDESGQGPDELITLGRGEFFGEKALSRTSKSAATMVAVGPVTMHTITREKLEQCIGPLSVHSSQAEAWRRIMFVNKEAVLRKRMAGTLKDVEFSELEVRGALYVTGCSILVLMEHTSTQNIYTVHCVEIREVTQLGHQELVLRRREITRALEPSLFVPHVVKVFKTDALVAELLMTNGLCSVDALLEQGPFDEALVVFVAASVVIALEQLHRSGLVFRGLSTETLLVTEEGFIQLTDFRFAKRLSGRTFTMCGHPEYMAPEMVENSGHLEEVDWWALGVLIYTLLSRQSPFAAPGDDEMAVYRKISAGTVTFPKRFSPQACHLLTQLLQKDPSQRAGLAGQGIKDLKEHPWFESINWTALGKHNLQPPATIRERIYNFEGLSVIPLNVVPVSRTEPWVAQF